MKKLFLILLIFFRFSSLFACDIPDHFDFSVQNNENEILYWGCYDAVNNGPHKVIWFLTYERTEGTGRANTTFTQQRDGGQLLSDLLEAGFQLPSHADFTGSGFDRGHMAPNSHFNDTDENSRLTFFIANVWPQTPRVNRSGDWYYHKQTVDFEYALEYGYIRIEVIVTEFSDQQIGRPERPISVPASFLRTAYCPEDTIIYQIIVMND